MTAQRTGHDAEENVLLGMSVEEAKAEAGRLAGKALELTIYLSRPRAGLTDVVRRNLEAERDGYEWDSAGLEARIAEHEGRVVKVREPGPPPSARTAGVRRRKQEVAR